MWTWTASCRAFAVMAQQVAGDTQSKMKRLSREMRNLRGKTSLPIHMASSIFVRHDTDRMDKVRAMITGGHMLFSVHGELVASVHVTMCIGHMMVL